MGSVQKIDKIPKTASKQKQLPVENRFVVARGRGLAEGWSGKLGLADVSCFIKKGHTTRSHCIV